MTIKKKLIFLIVLAIASSALAKSGVIVTRVNTFNQVTIPKKVKSGFCWTHSAAVSRSDAYRCKVKNEIFDPCFSIGRKKWVVCGIDPIKNENGFLVKLTKPLPRRSRVRRPKINSWILKLEDDVVCRPYTGTLPLVKVGDKIVGVKYGCNNDLGSEAIGLLDGYIVPGEVWRAKKIIYIPSGPMKKIIKIQDVVIKEVWK